jgi:imidazolonepropionase-like amidohydrolase
MKLRPILLTLSLLLSFLPVTLAQDIRAITGATLIDGTGRAPVKNAVVVIEGTRITAVGAASKTRIPKGAQLIDGRGKFIIPGLADMHNHLGDGYFLPGPGQGPPNFRQNLAQLLAWGFTTIHCPVRLDPALATAARDDASPLPRLWGVGVNRGFSTEGGHASQRPRFDSLLPKTPEEARQQVRSVGLAAGVNAIKIIYSDQSHRQGLQPLPIMKLEIMQALIDEAHKMGLKA